MKITLEYQIDRQDLEDLDYQDAICALHGRRAIQLLADYLHILRNTRKNCSLDNKESDFIISAEELLYSMADEVDLGDIIGRTISSETDTLKLNPDKGPIGCF